MKDKIFVIDDEYIGTYYDCIKLYYLNVIDITPYTATISNQKRMSRLKVALYVDGFILEGQKQSTMQQYIFAYGNVTQSKLCPM